MLIDPCTSRSRVARLLPLTLIALLTINGCDGCVGETITFAELVENANTAVSFLQLAKSVSDALTKALNQNTSELSTFGRGSANGIATDASQPFSLGDVTQDVPTRIAEMERRHTDMLGKSSQLHQALAQAEGAGKTFFTKIDTRARQVSAPNIRAELLSDEVRKRGEFEQKIDEAKTDVDQLDHTIKRYDDILAYVQIHQALDGLKFDELSRITADAKSFNTQVKGAIDQEIALLQSTLQAQGQPPAVQSQPLFPTPPPSRASDTPAPADIPLPPSPPALPSLVTGNASTLPVGTTISVKLDQQINFGQFPETELRGTLAAPLAINDVIIAERGATVEVRLKGKVEDSGNDVFSVSASLDKVTLLNGQRFGITTSPWSATGGAGSSLPTGSTLRFTLAAPVTMTTSQQ